MTLRSIARRYAAALFDVTRKTGTEDRAGRDLAAIAALVESHEQLRRTFETPAVPPQTKRAILEGLLRAAGDLSADVRRMLQLMAERDRLVILQDVAAAFEAKLMQARRIVPAEVVTAVPLDEHSRAALAQALGKAAGGQVTLTERVDPAIIGGVIAKVGSVVFDGSVTRQLERLGERMRTEA